MGLFDITIREALYAGLPILMLGLMWVPQIVRPR